MIQFFKDVFVFPVARKKSRNYCSCLVSLLPVSPYDMTKHIEAFVDDLVSLETIDTS